MDKRTGLLDCFTHAGGKQALSAELKRNLIAVLISHSPNLGLPHMADACGISYDILAWAAEWYVREQTLRAANPALISNHQKLPLTPIFGSGTLSSSDGQRFPTCRRSVTARSEQVFHPGRVIARPAAATERYSPSDAAGRQRTIVTAKRPARTPSPELFEGRR